MILGGSANFPRPSVGPATLPTTAALDGRIPAISKHSTNDIVILAAEKECASEARKKKTTGFTDNFGDQTIASLFEALGGDLCC